MTTYAFERLTLDQALAAASTTRSLEIGRGVLAAVPRLLTRHFAGLDAVIVADRNTFQAAGQRVQQAMTAAGHPIRPPFVFEDPDLHAEHRYVERLRQSLSDHRAIPIAVGSGTINDLVKLAAHRAGRQYLCVATAASMDGYTAYGASITHEGSKQTFDCPAPVAVMADLEVIAAAPPEMKGWGYADLLAKVTAGADWILADALGAEPIDPLAWSIVQGGLHEAVVDPTGVRRNDPEALGKLVEGLMLGGFAMQAMRSSRPASGAEHQFSHLWDMQHHSHLGQSVSHGSKVGIGTLAVTALYESLLARPLERIDPHALAANWPSPAQWIDQARRMFDDAELRTVATRETAAKSASPAELIGQLQRVRDHWPRIRARLSGQLIGLTMLREMLASAGAAVDPEQIGISRRRLRESFRMAFFIRRRFTVLDLAVRLGLLDEIVDSLFGPKGPWPIAATQTT